MIVCIYDTYSCQKDLPWLGKSVSNKKTDLSMLIMTYIHKSANGNYQGHTYIEKWLVEIFVTNIGRGRIEEVYRQSIVNPPQGAGPLSIYNHFFAFCSLA
jgi:hypothetical protein